MAAAKKKKKPKIQAADVQVANRTLEGVLIDLAEQVKANDARYAERLARAEQVSEEARQVSAEAQKVSAEAQKVSAEARERSARAEEGSRIALEIIAAVTQDLRAITKELRAINERYETRLTALENA